MEQAADIEAGGGAGTDVELTPDEIEQRRREAWRGIRSLCLMPCGLMLGVCGFVVALIADSAFSTGTPQHVAALLRGTRPILACVLVLPVAFAFVGPALLRWAIVRQGGAPSKRVSPRRRFIERHSWMLTLATIGFGALVLLPILSLVAGTFRSAVIGPYLLGCVMAAMSLRGTEPNCTRCGYAQSIPPQAAACSECGSDLSRSLAIVLGRERVSWWMLAAGVVLSGASLWLAVVWL